MQQKKEKKLATGGKAHDMPTKKEEEEKDAIEFVE